MSTTKYNKYKMFGYWSFQMSITEVEASALYDFRLTEAGLLEDIVTLEMFMKDRVVSHTEKGDYICYLDLVDIIFLFEKDIYLYNTLECSKDRLVEYYQAASQQITNPLQKDDCRWIDVIQPLVDRIDAECAIAFLPIAGLDMVEFFSITENCVPENEDLKKLFMARDFYEQLKTACA